MGSYRVRFRDGTVEGRIHLDSQGRINWAYRLTLGRAPSTSELRLAEKYLSGASGSSKEEQDTWAQLVQALFASMDFRYVN